jgi:UDP-2,3-diacylglucosamine pyrophosphatase LpxH
VSDVHLGYDKSDKNNFQTFLESETISDLTYQDHLVLLGDIVDFWRKQNSDIFLDNKNESILSKLIETSLKTNTYYIIGNHDYSILSLACRYGENYFPFKVSKNLRLENGQIKFYFTHGYELEVFSSLEPLTINDYECICEILCNRTGGFTGRLFSGLWDYIKSSAKLKKNSKVFSIQKPPKERLDIKDIETLSKSIKTRGIFLGMKENEYLVFGHTHYPFVDNERRVANSGSWIKYDKDYDSYLVIENGKIDLKFWKQ